VGVAPPLPVYLCDMHTRLARRERTERKMLNAAVRTTQECHHCTVDFLSRSNFVRYTLE